MPATSKAQQKLMQIAEHHPEELYTKNKGVAKMTHRQLHDFSVGSEKGKPEHIDKGHHNVKNPKGHASKLRSS